MQWLCVAVLVHLLMKDWIQPVRSLGKDAVAMRMTNILSSRNTDGQNEISRNITEEEVTSMTQVPQVAWTNEDGCGVVTATLSGHSPRIVGGEDAAKGEWPWIAMLLRYYRKSNKFTFVCGGSLIRKQWVLTAGHCFFGGSASYTHVVLGAHRKDLTDSTATEFAIARYICYPTFRGMADAFKDDACLVKLAGEVEYSDYIKPICLPTLTQRVSFGDECKIAGWGETQDTGNNKILQQATVYVLNKLECNKWYMEYDVTLPVNHICAGYIQGKIDSCQGDSGGPLTSKKTVSKKTMHVLFGLTSFGIGCAQPNLPGVYTDVHHYTDWIATTIAQHSEPETCFDAFSLIPCGTSITRSGTIIRTPAVDTRTWLYPRDTHCIWSIDAPPGCSIYLQFNCFFHVEINPNNVSECYDYMKIESEQAGINALYCGSVVLNPITIGSNKATLSFRSDSSVQSSGFVVKVLFLSPRRIITQTNSTTDVNETTNPSNRQGTIPDATSGHHHVSVDNNNRQVPTSKCLKTDCNSAEKVFQSSKILVFLLSHALMYTTLYFL